MQVSDAIGFRLQVKMQEFAYHMEIERADAQGLYKVRYGRGLTNHTYLIPDFIWMDFLEYCKRLGVFTWEEIYDFPSYNGDGWITAFQFPKGEEISFAGKDETPPRWAEFLDYVQYFSTKKSDGLLPESKKEVLCDVEDDLDCDLDKVKEITKTQPIQAMKSDFIPDFLEQNPGDYMVKLEDIFTEEELSKKEGNALDRQVAKFSSFVKTGSHTFVNLIMDSFDEDKDGDEK
jgi:hypothetical protein